MVRKDRDVNENERLSNFTLRRKLKYRHPTNFIVTANIGFSIRGITYTLKLI